MSSGRKTAYVFETEDRHSRAEVTEGGRHLRDSVWGPGGGAAGPGEASSAREEAVPAQSGRSLT